ncbi:MAG TPA: glycerophosphodiester phosphodiesterase family protein [Syntrophales bacterium]|nr:glycerophosphodiester phosphodiesterase family protein [Syntrophales bacterium]
MERYLCFAHRGASGHEPENTLAAVVKAVDLGAHWIEVDVYAVTRELIVIHDERLDRTTSGTGYVMEKTFDHLRSLDAGKGERIPTLREIFDAVDKKAGINVELKGERTGGLTVSLIEEYVKKHKWTYEQFIVSSFNRRELKLVRKLNPKIRIGILIDRPRRHYARFARRYAAYSLHINVKLANARSVKRAHERGLRLFVYTVNSPEDVVRLEALGVDGIFTDFPGIVIRS